MNTTLYGIVNCDTVKQARGWLDQHDAAYAFVDLKKPDFTAQALDRWIAALGWEALVNRSGMTWRKLDEAERARVVDAASARALMLAQPTVIKRPVVEWPDGNITAGFRPDEFAARSASRSGSRPR
jgi:Spx/MgsR family transcriptional regulator